MDELDVFKRKINLTGDATGQGGLSVATCTAFRRAMGGPAASRAGRPSREGKGK